MRKLPFYILIILAVLSCNNEKKNKKNNILIQAVEPTLEFLWETDTLLTTCESVLYDKSSQTIYVANVNNAPWEKDNNGFISKLNTEGEITNLKWIEGLSGPKGMGAYKGKLYVNDIDEVVEIDVATKEIANKFVVEGAPQLNDITVSDDAVYISGSGTDAIYKIENGNIRLVANDTLGRLNGLLHQKDGIYFAASRSHHFGVFNENNSTFKVLTTDIGHGDGIIRLENGDFIVSSWSGEIFYIKQTDWSKIKLLDTREQKVNAADIDYIEASQILLIPTFFNNTVRAYRLAY
ncbi:MAG: hypothetical protein ACON5F_05745 [Jejuia sp.]